MSIIIAQFSLRWPEMVEKNISFKMMWNGGKEKTVLVDCMKLYNKYTILINWLIN